MGRTIPHEDDGRVRGCRVHFQHFGRFGTPDVIHTDHGPAFCNELFAELTRLSKVEHSFATAYSKEENGILFDARMHEKWSYEQLPMEQHIMNAVEKTSTGVTPAELILNNSIRLLARNTPGSQIALSNIGSF